VFSAEQVQQARAHQEAPSGRGSVRGELPCRFFEPLRGRELLLEPVAEAGIGHARIGAGEERPLARVDAEIGRLRIGDDLARIVAPRQHATDQLVEAELLGPATSTVPLSGSPTDTRPPALATSSAAIGWMSAGGSRTVLPSVASMAIRFMNS
jgi:hypothetical protein